jgi:hypothetical protein
LSEDREDRLEGKAGLMLTTVALGQTEVKWSFS